MTDTNPKSRYVYLLKGGPFNGETFTIEVAAFAAINCEGSVYKFPENCDASNCSELIYFGEQEMYEEEEEEREPNCGEPL